MKLYIAVFLSICGGALISTGIGKLNGVPACVIYGFCEGDPIEENEKLRTEIDELKKEREKLRREMDDKILDLEQTVNTQAEKITQTKDILISVKKISKGGMNSEDFQIAVANKLSEIANILATGTAAK